MLGALRAQNTTQPTIVFLYRLGLDIDLFHRIFSGEPRHFACALPFGDVFSDSNLHRLGHPAFPKTITGPDKRDEREPRHQRSVASSLTGILHWIFRNYDIVYVHRAI